MNIIDGMIHSHFDKLIEEMPAKATLFNAMKANNNCEKMLNEVVMNENVLLERKQRF